MGCTIWVSRLWPCQSSSSVIQHVIRWLVTLLPISQYWCWGTGRKMRQLYNVSDSGIAHWMAVLSVHHLNWGFGMLFWMESNNWPFFKRTCSGVNSEKMMSKVCSAATRFRILLSDHCHSRKFLPFGIFWSMLICRSYLYVQLLLHSQSH